MPGGVDGYGRGIVVFVIYATISRLKCSGQEGWISELFSNL